MFWDFDFNVLRKKTKPARVFEFEYICWLILIGQLVRACPISLFILLFYFWGNTLGQMDGGCPHDLRVRGLTPSTPLYDFLFLIFFSFIYFPLIFIPFYLIFLPLIFILLKIFPTQTHTIFVSTILLCFILFHLNNFWWTYEVLNIGN